MAFGSSLRLMRCISTAQLISIFKVSHQRLKGEGEAKLLEGNKPNQNSPQQQEAGNGEKYFSLEAAGWREGCCKGRASRKHQHEFLANMCIYQQFKHHEGSRGGTSDPVECHGGVSACPSLQEERD